MRLCASARFSTRPNHTEVSSITLGGAGAAAGAGLAAGAGAAGAGAGAAAGAGAGAAMGAAATGAAWKTTSGCFRASFFCGRTRGKGVTCREGGARVGEQRGWG